MYKSMYFELQHNISSFCTLNYFMEYAENHILLRTSTMASVQVSSRTERTLEISTLSRRWIPAQEMQRNTPRLMDAHSGSAGRCKRMRRNMTDYFAAGFRKIKQNKQKEQRTFLSAICAELVAFRCLDFVQLAAWLCHG